MSARLIKAGYITKTPSATDKQAVELTATDTGREALMALQVSFDQINSVLDAAIGDEDMKKFCRKPRHHNFGVQ